VIVTCDARIIRFLFAQMHKRADILNGDTLSFHTQQYIGDITFCQACGYLPSFRLSSLSTGTSLCCLVNESTCERLA